MDAKKLGQFIAELRKEKGMTQAELASKLHVTDKAVSKWERGLGLPDINSIEPLADALGISVAEVMQAKRIPDDHVTQDNASEMLTNAFDMVKQQRRMERKHHILIFVCVLLAIVLVFLGDTMLSNCLPAAMYSARTCLTLCEKGYSLLSCRQRI